jgi:hypothetical protein
VDPQVQERLREVAGELRQVLYGEKGCPEWGTLFREIENDGMAVGLELARLLMEQTTLQQAQELPAEAMQVPDDVVEPAGTEEARLQTPAGEVAWDAPCGYLKTGRKAFFPSAPRVGAGRGRDALAGPAPEGDLPGDGPRVLPASPQRQ